MVIAFKRRNEKNDAQDQAAVKYSRAISAKGEGKEKTGTLRPGLNYRSREVASRRRMFDSEGEAAGQAVEVVQNVGIDDFAETGTNGASSGSADQTGQDGAGDHTQGGSWWTGDDHAQRAADFGAGKHAGRTARSTGDHADRTTGAFGAVLGLNAIGITPGALEQHADSFPCGGRWT